MTIDSTPHNRRVTLDDVARAAGVSRALVSIVMRDVPGASPANRERVRAVADELGYRPDARARSLAGHSSKLIGVMFGTAFTFHFGLLDGLYSAADKLGYSLLLTAMTTNRDERQAAQALHDFEFDAVAMLGPSVAQPVLAGERPTVVLGWHVDDARVDVVRTNDMTGLKMAIDHLHELGHRRIAHIDGGSNLVSDSRRNAYVAAMTAHGLERHIRIIEGGETALDGQHAAQRIISDRRAMPTAVVTFNDDTAVAAIGVFRQHGILVPAEISVVGFDDGPLARDPDIDLTSVAQHPHAMAERAVARLHDRLQGVEVTDREIVLEPNLVIRSSTAQAQPARKLA